jgi:predicted translin family RNA/ssDNA-binding protein
MPEPPYTHAPSTVLPPFDLSDLAARVAKDDERFNDAKDLSRRLQVSYNQAKEAVEQGLPLAVGDERMAALQTLLQDTLIEATRSPRPGYLNHRVEDYVRLQAYRHFLATGQLWTLPAESVVTDEEYLAGACMGLSQDLSRYALGRATVRDHTSIRTAKELVAQVMDFLVQLDFRNGPLRRKYDGVKYALQALERFLYELAVTEERSSASSIEPPASKKARPSPTETPRHLAEIKERMDHRDELREKLIKKCRDGQKAAKQAIYALHRGDRTRATALMEQCEACIVELSPTVEEEPPLRGGAFGNMVEEYVEAKLFATWLEASEGSETAAGKMLVPADFTVIALKPEEYLGGVCDLTGEIGRYAVQRGTERDLDGVRLCLQSNQRILSAIQSMPVFPSSIGKKMDTLRRSIEKLERMLYELSLSAAAGGRPVTSEVASGDHNNNEEES